MLGLFFLILWILWELSTQTIFEIIELNHVPGTKQIKKLQLSSERHVGQLHGI